MSGSSGLSFREVMSGPAALAERDPELAVRARAAQRLVMYGTVTIDDVEAFVADVNHRGRLDVRMSWPPFGNDIPAPGGVFQLFSRSSDPLLKLMVYEWAVEHGGRKYYFAGQKEVRVHPLFNVWHDTTALYTRIHDGPDKSGPVVGAGIIALSPLRLAGMLPTFRFVQSKSAGASFRALTAFGRFFLGELWDTYVRRTKH
jgi:hypothetical protein